MIYTLNYFIRKFSKIPSHKIGEGSLEDKCPLYHCGVRSYSFITPEAISLANFLRKETYRHEYDDAMVVWRVNDSSRFGRSPKSRILSVLRKLKRTIKGH